MRTLLTTKEIRLAEQMAISMGKTELELMREAAEGLAQSANFVDKKTVIFCGSGKNGGDGLALACLLQSKGCDVVVFLISNDLCSEAKHFFDKYCKLGGKYRNYNKNAEIVADIIVDCIFGTGLNRDVSGLAYDAVCTINNSKAYVISADVPSGLNVDLGSIMGVAVKADITVSFSGCKFCYEYGFGKDLCGQIRYADMSIPAIENNIFALEESDIELTKRDFCSHKGSNGKVYIIAGSPCYIGSALLAESAATAALKTGAGLVTLVVPFSLREVYQKRVTEATLMFLPDVDGKIIFDKGQFDKIISGADVIAIGMGLGQNDELFDMVKYLTEKFRKPIILDADAINCLQGRPIELNSNVILTPHIKEFERVLGRKISNAIEDGRDFCRRTGAILHLKSSCSLTFSPSCDEILANISLGSELAKGGSGDVLSGIAAAIVVGRDDLARAVAEAAEVHRRTAHCLTERENERSILASEIVQNLGKYLKNI